MLELILQRKKLLLALAAIFLPMGILLGAVQGFLLSKDVAGQIRLTVRNEMAKAMGVPVRVDDARVGVFGRLVFTGVAIGSKAQLRADEAVVHYNLFSFLRNRNNPVGAITRIDLIRPTVEATMDAGGRLDVLNMFRFEASSTDMSGPAYPMYFSNGTFLLKGLDVARMDAALWAAGGMKPGDTPESVMARGYAPRGEPLRVDGVSGVVRLTGGPDLELDLGGSFRLLRDTRIGLAGTWGWHRDRVVYQLTISGADVDAAELWRLAAFPGDFGWAQGGSGRLTADLSLAESGAYDYKVRYAVANGLYTGPGPLGQVSSVAGDVVATPAALEAERLGFVYRGSHWTVDGKVSFDQVPVLNLAVNTAAADLSQVPRRLLGTFGIGWPEELSLGGKAQVSLSLRGPVNSPLLRGSLRPKKASALWKRAALPLTDLEGEIALDGQTAIAKGLTGRWGESRVKISGEVNGVADVTTAKLALDVAARDVRGADLAALAGTTGELGRALHRSGLVAAGEARVTGKPLDPEVAGTFTVLAGRVEPWDLKGFSGAFHYAGNAIDISRAGWTLQGGDLRGSGSISWRGATPDYAFSLAGEKIPLSSFPQAADFGLEGLLSGTLAAKGSGWDPNKLTLSAQGTVTKAVLLGQPLTRLAAQVAMVGGRLSLDYLRAESAPVKLSAGGLLDRGADVHLVVTVPEISRLLGVLPVLTAQAAKKRFWAGDRGRLALLGQVANWGRELRALNPSGTVTLDGRLTAGAAAASATPTVAPAASPVPAAASARGDAGGAVAFDGLLDWKKAALAGQRLDHAAARLRVNNSRLDVSSVELANGAVTVRGAGVLDLETGRLRGVWLKTNGADARVLFDLVGLRGEAAKLGLGGELSLILRAGGSLAKPSLSGEATLGSGELLGEKVSNARFRVSTAALALESGKILDLSAASWRVEEAVAAGPWGKLSSSGTAGPDGLALAVQGENIKLEKAEPLLARLEGQKTAGQKGAGAGSQSWLATLDGTASVNGKIAGTWSRPQFEGSASISRPAFQVYRFDRFTGRFAFRDGLLEVPAASLTRGKASYSVSGQARLSPSRVGAGGARPVGERPGDGQRGETLPSYDFRVEAAGTPLAELADTAGIQLAHGVDGAVSGTVHVWGAGADVSAHLTADVRDGRVAGLGVSGGADVEFSRGQVTVSRLRLEQGQGVLSASGTVGHDQALAFSVSAGRFDAATLASVLRLPYCLGGTVDLKGKLSGYLDNPAADLGFTVRDGSIQNVTVDELSGNLSYKNGFLSLKDGAIRRGSRAAEASGSIPVPDAVLRSLGLENAKGARADAQMDLSVKMPQGDLSLASLIDPALSIPSGVGNLELHLGGTWKKPLVDGQVRVSKAVVRYRGVSGEATDVNAAVDFDGQKVLVRNLSARYFGGSVIVRGGVELGSPWLQALDLTASATGVHYQAPFLDAGVDGTITVKGSMPHPSVSGRITLTRAQADFGKWPGGLDALGGAGTGGSGNGGNAGGDTGRDRATGFDPTFDVVVEPKGDFHAVGAGLVDIYGNGQVGVRGSLSRPSLSGRLDVTRGTLNYLDTPFAITDGRAEFATYRGLIPYLSVTAETTVSDTQVRLFLSGPADRLTQTLTSDPPLEEDQIMALLGLPGRVSRLAEGDARAAFQSEMLQLLDQQVSGRLLSSLEQKVKDVLQLDEFRIKAGLGLESFSVQLGKYLFDNLYVSYSRTFAQKPYESFRLELRLTPSILLSSGLDNTGDLRLGVETKFRF